MAQEDDVQPQMNRYVIIGGAAAVVLCCCVVVGGLLLFGDFWCDVPVANQIAVLCP
jgi:hypothetical protein